MATNGTRGYQTATYGLELNGTPMGSVESFEGGYATSDVVVEKVGADRIAHKHLSGVKYEEISITCGAAMSDGFYDWLKQTLNGSFTRQNGAIVTYDFNRNEVSRLSFLNALVTEVGFPALDASSKDSATLSVKLTPSSTKIDKANSSGKANFFNQKAKTWLPSNFRIQIDGLDCTRVNRIEAIAVTQSLVENPVGETRDYQVEPAYLVVPNLVITLADDPRAQNLHDWHESFVVNGNNGQDQEKNGTLECLSSDLKSALFTLELKQLGIFRLAPANTGAASGNISRVQAEMYCEQILFNYGTSIAATASAQAGANANAGQSTDISPSGRGPRNLTPLQAPSNSTPLQGPRNLPSLQEQATVPSLEAPRTMPSLRFRT